MLKKVEEIGNVVNKMLADRDEEIENLKQQLPKDAAAITAAEEAMQTATDAGDVKAYSKAKSDRHDATDAQEMHKSRLNKLEGQPLISEGEYKKLLADLYGEVDKLENLTKEKLFMSAREMKDTAEEFEEAVNFANKILFALQHDIYRDADRKRDRDGKIMRLLHENKTLNKSLTIDWGKGASKNTLYRILELETEGKNGK